MVICKVFLYFVTTVNQVFWEKMNFRWFYPLLRQLSILLWYNNCIFEIKKIKIYTRWPKKKVLFRLSWITLTMNQSFIYQIFWINLLNIIFLNWSSFGNREAIDLNLTVFINFYFELEHLKNCTDIIGKVS